MIRKIKTNIKFYKGLDNVADQIYGFVTKVNGSWRGCRETEQSKKIVFVDPAIRKDIVPNMLYKCSLVPMRTGDGFVAVSATMVKFKGTIITTHRNNVYQIHIKFGNKDFLYDPSCKDKQRNDIKTIADSIRNRLDLENAVGVAEDFVDNACMIKRLYEQSKTHV